ncbi:MAG: hypothetical protein J7502_00255 [Flavisolibacter sp.]|nr:hypothetical protein [Flavisolibacter sp.]
MFNNLQKKWKVRGWQLLLILIVFALGGSLTGYIGKKLMGFFEIEILLLYIIIYILIVTIIWPFAVLLVSIPFGQFAFLGGILQGWEPGCSPERKIKSWKRQTASRKQQKKIW